MTETVRPPPRPDPLSQGFWDATARGELAIQRCAACRMFQHPPRPMCRDCGSTDLAFEKVSGEGRLWSWTVTHHNVIAGLEPALPYTNLLVELVEQNGIFLLSDLIGRQSEERLRLGMPMRVVFPDQSGGGPILPQFVPANSTEQASQ